MKNLQHWVTLSSQELLSLPPRIKVFVDKVKLPDGRIVDDFYQIELSEYVVIFAQTPEGSVVMERHYKHGLKRVVFTLPAGCLEPGEEPLAGAKRELAEETGFEAGDWRSLGSYVVNGNQGCGKAHLFLALEAHQTRDVSTHDLEETEVLLMTPGQVIKAVKSGKVATLASIAAVALALNAEFPK